VANIINNTDLDKISQTIADGKKDKQSLRKPVKLQGEWNLDPSKGYQFRTELSYEKGKEVEMLCQNCLVTEPIPPESFIAIRTASTRGG